MFIRQHPMSGGKSRNNAGFTVNVDKECYLVYEMAKKSGMGQGDIWVTVEEDDVKYILFT